MLFNGYRVAKFKAPLTACRGCHLRPQCLCYPDRTPQRQLTIIKAREGPPRKPRATRHAAIERMCRKFDTPLGRELYSRRMGTVEPVFGDLQNRGMGRCTLRGRKKVNAQWQLFAMVHNIEKIDQGGGRSLKAGLDERDVLDAYDGIVNTLDELEWPLERLEDFFEGNIEALDKRSAYIFTEFCERRMQRLRDCAEEIDEEYKTAAPLFRED